MRIAALALLLASTTHAQTGIDAVVLHSQGLGYEPAGFGIALQRTSAHFDARFTALQHPKRNGRGPRYHATFMGRYHFDNWYAEVGGRWAGYDTRFDDGRHWRKYGHAAGVGIGSGNTHLRYFFPNNTPNNTSVIALTSSVGLGGNWYLGGSVEKWKFDGSRSGTQSEIRIGVRF